jgi:hypothetical protein
MSAKPNDAEKYLGTPAYSDVTVVRDVDCSTGDLTAGEDYEHHDKALPLPAPAAEPPAGPKGSSAGQT